MYNLLTTYAIDLYMPIAKWVAIGVIAFMLLSWLVVFLLKKENVLSFIKTTLYILFAFLLVVGIIGLILEIAKSFNPTYIEDNYLDRTGVTNYILIPVTCLLCLFLSTIIAIAITNKKSLPENKKQNVKKVFTIFGILDLVALIASGILMTIYFESVKEWYPTLNQTVLYISSALVIIVIIALGFILDNNDKPIDTKCLAFAGITIAMSFGLSYIKLFEMPQGGAVTLFSLLPIMLFSYVYGTKKGVLVCFTYGILQAIQDPWIIHPAQFLLDYPVAFSAIGLSGAFSKVKAFNKIPQVAFLTGGIMASALRFFSHVLSGVFAFAETYAGDLNSWIYSLGYNSFVFVDIAIVLLVGAIVFSSKAFIKELNKLPN